MKTIIYKSFSLLAIGLAVLCVGCNGKEKTLRHTLDSLQALYHETEKEVALLMDEEREQNEKDSLNHENNIKIHPSDFIQRSSADAYWSKPEVGIKLKSLGFKKVSSKTIGYDDFSTAIQDEYSDPYAEKSVYSRTRKGETEKVVLNYYSFMDGDEGFSFIIDFPNEMAKDEFVDELLSMPDMFRDGSKITVGRSKYRHVFAEISRPLKIEIFDEYSRNMPR